MQTQNNNRKADTPRKIQITEITFFNYFKPVFPKFFSNTAPWTAW